MPCDWHRCWQCSETVAPEEADFGAWSHHTTRGHRVSLINVSTDEDMPPAYARHLARALLDAADYAEEADWKQSEAAKVFGVSKQHGGDS